MEEAIDGRHGQSAAYAVGDRLAPAGRAVEHSVGGGHDPLGLSSLGDDRQTPQLAPRGDVDDRRKAILHRGEQPGSVAGELQFLDAAGQGDVVLALARLPIRQRNVYAVPDGEPLAVRTGRQGLDIDKSRRCRGIDVDQEAMPGTADKDLSPVGKNVGCGR